MKKSSLLSFLLAGAMLAPTAAFSLDNPGLELRIREHGEAVQERAAASRTLGNRAREIPYVQDEVMVKYRGDEQFRRVRLPRGERVASALARLNRRSDVVSVEPNYIAYAFAEPNDTFYRLQWHLDNPDGTGVEAEEAWEISRGGNVVVAVIDTGVAYENYTEWFFTRYYQAPDLADTAFVSGYDFVNRDTHPNDDNGHGTHVAGTVAQSTNNNEGVAGLAYQATLMPIKVLDSRGSGTYADVASGIRWAADHGADVINLSLGGSSPASYLEDAVRYAHEKGVTIVAAAGNDGKNGVSYPAAYDDYVIAVGATRYDAARSSYSNYGSSLDLVAPGGDLSVDQNGDSYGDGVLQQTFGRSYNDWGYYFYQGTSMAAPHAAGAAALIIAAGSGNTPDEVRATLERSAQDLGPAGRDDEFGHGLVDAAAALGTTSAPPPDPEPEPEPEPSPTPTDNPPTVSLTAPQDGAIISGTTTITADANDDNGVAQVEFYANATLLGSDTDDPYAFSLDTTSLPDGTHTLSVKAVDSAGQEANDSVDVIVENVNEDPAFTSSPPLNAKEGEPYAYDADANDPDPADALAFSLPTAPANMTIDATSGLIEWTPAAGDAGTADVIVRVEDNRGGSAEQSFSITVEAAPSQTPSQSVLFEEGFEGGLSAWSQDWQSAWRRSSQRSSVGSYSAEVDGRAFNAVLTSPTMQLSNPQDLSISFDWMIEQGFDWGEYLAFDISTNGGSWQETRILRGNESSEGAWQNETIQLSGASSIQIRFRAFVSSRSEDAYVDNVSVTAQ